MDSRVRPKEPKSQIDCYGDHENEGSNDGNGDADSVDEEHQSQKEGEQREMNQGRDSINNSRHAKSLNTFIQAHSHTSTAFCTRSTINCVNIVSGPLLDERSSDGASQAQTQTNEPQNVCDNGGPMRGEWVVGHCWNGNLVSG